MISDLTARALERAKGQVGQKEDPLGSNWGHPVQDYLSSVGIYFAASWCMSFIYWCFNDAANQLGVLNPMFKTGGVLAQWSARRSYSIGLNDPNKPVQPGDIFIMDLGHGLGHTGIVETINPDGSLGTIEGNTNDTGSREGIEVARKIRYKAAPIIGFLRF